MPRHLLIPALSFDASSLASGAVASDNVTSREDPDGREVRPATRGATNIGALNPIPVGLPTADVDVDLLLRSPGNTDAARWTWRDADTAQNYRAKEQASVLHHVRMFYSAVSDTNRVASPRLLSLSSDLMLLLYLVGGTSSYGTSVAWRTWRRSARSYNAVAGWSAAATISLAITPPSIIGADAVQFPDTGEIAVFVLGYSGTRPIIQRLTSDADDDNTAPLSWAPGPCRFFQKTVNGLRSMAVEIMPGRANRLAMLIQDDSSGGGLWRSYSDDRGVTWSTWEKAGQFGDASTFAPGSAETTGGVSIGRARNGTLVAIAPCLGPNYAPITGWADGEYPRMRLLFSDDGDSWNDAIRASQATDGNTTPVTTADALLENGINQGAVVCGDDGLVRLFACYHGDTRGDVDGVIRDELALLTLAKPDVTAADVGRNLTQDQAYDVTGTTSAVVTCSDALEGLWDPVASALVLNKVSPNTDRPAATFGRIMSNNGLASAGGGSGNLDGSPMFRGVRQMDAVNHLGRLRMVVVGETTDAVAANTRFSMFDAATLGWTEQFELPPTNALDSIASNVIRGRTYEIGWLPTGFPNLHGWTLTGTAGNFTLNTSDGGLRVSNADTVASYHSVTSLPGGLDEHVLLYFTVVPVSGGALTADDIAVSLQTSDGTNFARLNLRFTPTSMRAVDDVGALTLASATGLDLSRGVEVKCRLTSHRAVSDIHYRVLSATDPEDAAAWVALLSTGGNNLTQAAGSSVFLRWGNLTTTAAVSAWRNIQLNRGRDGNTNGSELKLTDLDAAAYPELTDPSSLGVDSVPAWDDGLRHGSRAPVVTAEPAQYVSRGLLARWGGSAGFANPPDRQDSWRATASYACDATRVRRLPVSNLWRSADDDEASYLVFDAGEGRNWNHEAIAFFKCNAPTLRVQFASTNSWGSPDISIRCDTTDATNIRRDIYRRALGVGAISIDSADARVLRFNGDAATPLTPHRYRSTDARSYWVFSSVLNRTARILDNDGTHLFLDRSMLGAVTGDPDDDYISIYSDTIYFNVSDLPAYETGTPPGLLLTSGYRYMRLQIGDDADLAEGYQQLGLVIAGDLVPLSDPHPDWGWRETVIHARGRTDTPGAYSDIAEIGPTRRAWQFGWNFMNPPQDRTTYETAPGNRAGWERVLYALLRLRAGEEVAALLPDYGNTADEVSGMGLSTERVYPVRFTGDPDMVHVCYERCRDDLTDEAYKSLAGVGLEEVT